MIGMDVTFRVRTADRADLAAMLIEVFGGENLNTDERNVGRRPVRYGVPTAVAVDGKPAIAAWLYVTGDDKAEVADVLGVGEGTVTEYLSRFRRRGDGIPDDVDILAVGDHMPEIPPQYDPVPDGGVDQ